jgi:amino acid transporter
VHASLGADHRLFAWLGRWHPRWNSPVASLVAQAGVTLGLMTIVGTTWGQRQLDALNNGLGFEPLNWGKYGGGFGLLITTTAPVFWFFFFLTGTALIVLRWKDPETERPFRAPFFPVLPLIFCGTCVYMFHASIEWAGTLALIPLVPLSLGIALYFASQLMGDERQA